MKKHELTTVASLQIGDRFYFQADKNKVVWEIVEHKSKQTLYRTYTYFCLLGDYADRIQDHDLRAMNAKGIQENTKVVYLGSKEVRA